MSLFSKLFKRRQPKAPPAQVRAYNLASVDRLTSDWIAGNSDANKEIECGIKLMRQRAREMERNNDYMRGYFRLLENNVLGHCGIGLEMKVTEMAKAGKSWVKQYDRRANDLIERAWAKFCRREFCTTSADRNWLDLQRLTLRSASRDGAILVREWASGPFGYQLEPLEIDHLNMDWLSPSVQGNTVRLGVEYTPGGRIAGYWLLKKHPGDTGTATSVWSGSTFVPASEMLHIYRPERVGQSTGVPWLHSAGSRLKNLGAYEEAEVIAARAGASKMAFLERTNSEPYTGVQVGNERQMEIAPGTIEELPPGMTLKPFDVGHPNSNLNGFIKAELRGIAAGLGLSYVSFANDLEGVNYSSIRAGLLEERENWKATQEWFIDWFVRPVFEHWLQAALSMGAIEENGQRLPASKFDKFNMPEFKPRRWDWVDPLKDMQASVLAVEKGFTSRRAVIAESGGDIEAVFADQAADKALEEESGLDFSAESGQQANKQPTQPKKGDDPEGALTTDKE